MKTITLRNRIFLTFVFIFSLTTTIAQVGINTIDPKDGSLLDIDSNNKGVFIPRVNIADLNNIAPVTGIANNATARAAAEGLLVYNTNTTNGPGYFFWSGSEWLSVGDGDGEDDWKRIGNAGTTAGTNFIGTTDSQDLQIRTNNNERVRLLANGQVIINDAGAPIAGDRFTVQGANNEKVLNGYASGANGVGVYGESASNNGVGVFGNVAAGFGVVGQSTGGGRGLQGQNNGTGFGVIGFSESTGIGVQGQNAGTGTGVIGIVNNANAVGVAAINLNPLGVGLVAAANPSSTSLAGTGGTLSGTIGAAGFSTNTNGTGIAGVGNNGNTTYNLTTGSGVSGTGSSTGVYGIAVSSSGNRQGGYFTMNKNGSAYPSAADDPLAMLAGYNGTDYFGGYFDGNQDNNAGGGGGNAGEDYAYVGIRSGGTTYKIIGTGSNSTMVNDSEGNKRVLFSPEAPEILFEDYGIGKLTNGQTNITIDSLLASVIHVSNEYPLKVFIQPEGDCNGVYVTNKTANGFTVIELNDGRSNVPFSWHIVANRADSKTRSGTVVSKHVNVRFPIGPEKITPSIVESKKTKKLNSSKNKFVDSKNPISNKK